MKQEGEDMMENRIFLCIDLKSFYASAECVERGLDPMCTNLVVADASRTMKTICLAVTPPLKRQGIPGRPRLFEVAQRVKSVNAERVSRAPKRRFEGFSYDEKELEQHPEWELSYITAVPRMALYMEYSTKIYHLYLKYIAPEDIHVYSIDEVFIDLTTYLPASVLSPREFAKKMILDIFQTTGITATAGIGTNMYLAKVAMDIVAKHIPADEDGVRIAELDELSYRKQLWNHQPLTDFWRVGRGYAKKLRENGMYTMGDVARCSIGKTTDYYNEDLLYKLFGVNAELLIDHAWGWEPCTIAEVKQYKPSNNSVGSGQVLHCAYEFEKAKLVVREMTELLVLDLVEKGLVTDQIVLTIGYDIENLTDAKRRQAYRGPVTTDYYGRKIPKHAHGTANIGKQTSSTKLITDATMQLYDQIVNPLLLIRRITIAANHVVSEEEVTVTGDKMEQLDLFTDYEALERKREEEARELEREKKMQHAVLEIKKKFGKNAILKGTSLEEGATAKDRNAQIGGHKA